MTMKTFYKELLKQGKDVKWLADKLEVSTQTVYLWKLGRSKPKPNHLVEIAKLLKINSEVLIKEFYS